MKKSNLFQNDRNANKICQIFVLDIYGDIQWGNMKTALRLDIVYYVINTNWGLAGLTKIWKLD